jgi:4-hydroxy-tetrahydrodipicolinate synthase
VGTGTITTASTIALSQYAEEVGADGVLVVPHSYWKPTQDELYLHYKTVAESVSLPLVVYNNPVTTGVDILPWLVAKLSRIENVVAIKESSGNVGRVEEIRLLCDDDFAVFCGDETLCLPSFCMGAGGWFTATANIIPRACVELYELVVEREELASARQLYDKMIPLMQFLVRTGLIRSVMTALPMMGRPVGEPQAPIQLLGDDDRAELKQLLQSWELL